MHTHLGADERQLAEHLPVYHNGVAENDLPTGWHLHFCLCGVCYPLDAGDGWTAIPIPNGIELYDQNEPLVFEDSSSRSLDRIVDLCLLGPSSWACSRDKASSPERARLLQTLHLSGLALRAHLSAYKQLSVMLI
jgi:hypothetical protein